jgi:hypothetical protein
MTATEGNGLFKKVQGVGPLLGEERFLDAKSTFRACVIVTFPNPMAR